MIRRTFFTASLLLLFSLVSGQDLVKRVAMEICNCVDTIGNMDSLDAKLNRCAPLALETILESSSEEIQEAYSTDEAFEETLKKAFEVLLSECPKIRYYIIGERRSTFYRESDSEDANNYYEAGNAMPGKETHELALVIFAGLKEKNKLDLFCQKAKEYGIAVDGEGK